MGDDDEDQVHKQTNAPLVCGSLSWLSFARALAFISIVWNIFEGGASLYAGFEHMQLSLLAYGAQSIVEVISAVLVWWRLAIPIRTAAEERRVIERERIAVRAIGVLFVLLALAVVGGAVLDILHREGPSSTLPGLIISSGAALAMLIMYVLKMRAAKILDSNTLKEDALCSRYCFTLSLGVIFASVVSLAQGSIDTWCHAGICDCWWIDAVVALVLAVLIFYDGVRAVRLSFNPDFDGGCGCCASSSTRVAAKVKSGGGCGDGGCGDGGCGGGMGVKPVVGVAGVSGGSACSKEAAGGCCGGSTASETVVAQRAACGSGGGSGGGGSAQRGKEQCGGGPCGAASSACGSSAGASRKEQCGGGVSVSCGGGSCGGEERPAAVAASVSCGGGPCGGGSVCGSGAAKS